jgi:hypothetical protein
MGSALRGFQLGRGGDSCRGWAFISAWALYLVNSIEYCRQGL